MPKKLDRGGGAGDQSIPFFMMTVKGLSGSYFGDFSCEFSLRGLSTLVGQSTAKLVSSW